MSKKKVKAAPKKKSASIRRATVQAGPDANSRTVQATIFLFRTGQGNRIRTSPQRLWANPGDRIEWTVVNMIDGTDVPVTISWPTGGPWGKEPIQFHGSVRQNLDTGAAGRFKYVVSALNAQEDPEVEIPDI
jgi:hypothetical protein